MHFPLLYSNIVHMHNLYFFFRYILSSIFLLCLNIQNIPAQTLGVGFCAVFTHTRQKIRMVHSKDHFENTTYSYTLSYEQILGNKSSLQLSYIDYPAYIWIRFPEGSVIGNDQQKTLGIGFIGARVSKFVTSYSFNIVPHSSKSYFKLLLGLTHQFTKPNEWVYYDPEPPNGPDYAQTAPMRTEAFKTFQVLPSFGIKTGFVFWKRLELGLDIQGAYDFKPFQRMYFTYSYKGVPQETAVFETTGTGIFSSINLGYRLVKPKK